MVKIVLIEKNGNIATSNINTVDETKLYKKCNFRNDKHFSKQTSWKYKNKNSSDLTIHLYAKDDGRANSENKYDLPPPVDEQLYFGKMLLLCYDNENNKYVNFTKEDWEAKYEQLFGGFENLDEEDSEEEEEEEIPQHLQTKEGYSKEDGFVVDSNDSDDVEYIPSDEKDDSDEESASYEYSGEEEIGEEESDEEDEDSDDESDDDIEEILESDIEDDNSELEEEDYL
jgi:hypothetical protein